MNRFFTLLLAASCLTAVGQVTYPYNPDGNADGDIAVGDLQDFLVTYGNPFSPSEIMVGDSSLTYWVEQLSQTVQEQQTELNNLNHPLALAETDIKAFHELIWNPECFDGPAGRVFSVFNPDGDGFLRLAGSNQTDFKYVIVDDSVEVCNEDEAQELFSLRFWEGTLRNMTIPLHQKEKVIFFVHAESIQPEEAPQKNGLFWNSLIVSEEGPQNVSATPTIYALDTLFAEQLENSNWQAHMDVEIDEEIEIILIDAPVFILSGVELDHVTQLHLNISLPIGTDLKKLAVILDLSSMCDSGIQLEVNLDGAGDQLSSLIFSNNEPCQMPHDSRHYFEFARVANKWFRQ